MKFNKLAKEQGLSVSALAEKVSDILPNANGGTDVSETQKAQIIALLTAPESTQAFSLLAGDGPDPILAVFTDLITEESQRETPETVVGEMIARYLQDPTDLPNDPDYRTAIITYVDLVKKRQVRKLKQLSRLRSHLRKLDYGPSAAEPLQLEHFYSKEPNSTPGKDALNGKGQSLALNAGSTTSTTS